jgi:hypothetical protein
MARDLAIACSFAQENHLMRYRQLERAACDTNFAVAVAAAPHSSFGKLVALESNKQWITATLV